MPAMLVCYSLLVDFHVNLQIISQASVLIDSYSTEGLYAVYYGFFKRLSFLIKYAEKDGFFFVLFFIVHFVSSILK